jgi:hypothetical protein
MIPRKLLHVFGESHNFSTVKISKREQSILLRIVGFILTVMPQLLVSAIIEVFTAAYRIRSTLFHVVTLIRI